MKQKKDRGYSKEDLAVIDEFQNHYKCTRKEAYKRFDDKKKADAEGNLSINTIGPPLNNKRKVAKQEFLASANNAARILAAGFREEFLPIYEKFENFIRQHQVYFDAVQFFFKKHRRDGTELLLGEYNSLEAFLKKECGISERQYHRVIRTVKHPLLENGKKTDGGKKTPMLETVSSTATDGVLDGELEEETPSTTLKLQREITALKHQLKVASDGAIDATEEACDLADLVMKLRDVLEEIVNLTARHGNLIQPESFRLYLQGLQRQLRAFDENYDVVNAKAKAADEAV